MLGKKQQLLIDTTQRLLRRDARASIRRIFDKTHPADLAAVISHFDNGRRDVLFHLIERIDERAEVLSEMLHENAAEFLATMPVPEIVELLKAMENDDAADLLARLPEDLSKQVLDAIGRRDAEDLGDLMKYGEDTAGGIMTTDFIALHENLNAQEAIETIRANKDVDMAFYTYVVNDHKQLVGVLSLRKLVIVSPETVLKQIMEPNVVSVRLHTDQEDVARTVARYNLLAIPVVNDNNVLEGIVTVDDVIDVIREEATEDILKMAGAGMELVETGNVTKSVRARFPWLLVSCIGELIGAAVISPFVGQLQTHHYLALFMPIIMAMGGNIGTQSATVIVRGLATGYVDPKRMMPVFWREIRVALALGATYGLIVGGVSFAFSGGDIAYGLSVATSMVLAMCIAVTVGTLLPIILEKLHVDPAVATGPFVTSAVDVLGLLVYFVVSTALISMVQG
ncbi:MAG: magnesium transporter [Deltaproteobacteria bacterium]|nr:magnesium transporter [Deltaproteobacteria bacterium]